MACSIFIRPALVMGGVERQHGLADKMLRWFAGKEYLIGPPGAAIFGTAHTGQVGLIFAR